MTFINLPTQEKCSSRKATIVSPSPYLGCTSGQFRLKLALFYDTAHFYLIKRRLPLAKAFLKCL